MHRSGKRRSSVVDTIRVLSLNTWTEAPELLRRTRDIARELEHHTPHVVCLQEVFTPLARSTLLGSLLKHYHFVSAGRESVSFPVLGYLWSAVVLVVGAAVWFAFRPSAIVVAGWALLFLLALPQTIHAIVLTYLKRCTDGARMVEVSPSMTQYMDGPENHFDFMGTAILARRDSFSALVKEQVSPFSYKRRGYPSPSVWAPWTWGFWWFQNTFLRPGFLIARAMSKTDPKRTELVIVNAHLVIGDHNPARKAQVAEIVRAVQHVSKQYECSDIVWCGDFNAHHDQPELDLLHQAGFVDSVHAPDSARRSKQAPGQRRRSADVRTWDNQNPFVVPGDRDSRLDYVWSAATMEAAVHEVCFNCPPFVSDHYGVLATLMKPDRREEVKAVAKPQ